MMLAFTSAIAVIAGSTMAVMAQRYPAHTVVMEKSAGYLIMAGFVLLGSGLPIA